MKAAEQLASSVGTSRACQALSVPRASFYRRKKSGHGHPEPSARPRPTRALSEHEREKVLDSLNSGRFVDQAPAEVFYGLLDEGVYLCSIRTMYRILADAREVRERRDQLRHPTYQKPELLATAPNQVWSWDITKLLGPAKWTYFYLFVILDIFSRCVVGWMVASRESAELAQRLIRETVEKQGIVEDQLIIHSDRGPSMKSHGVAQLLGSLGVTKSHSRPHVSNDNPFSESQFKTLKYRPDFPNRFGSQEHARSFCQDFFHWYNYEHYHSGIAMLTPAMVHYGLADQVLAKRQQVLDAAYDVHPERFVGKHPSPAEQPAAVWINPPTPQDEPRVANQRLIETTSPEEVVPAKSELDISLLTSDLVATRPMDPVEIDLSLNTTPTQINMNREEAPVLSQESLTVQNGKRYTKFVTQVSQTR
jgi:putative transposase